MRANALTIVLRAGAAPEKARSGFTLMELLVAVGALAFVAVGVAAIFEATGRTVRAGRRVSDFSAYANLIEQQMRADFSAMTREGFLLIRNQYADPVGAGNIQLPVLGQPPNANDSVVPLYSDDLRPRPRRIDEIMFFAKGQYQSLRDTIDSRVVARSDAAAIYYGHGQRRINDGTASFTTPELSDNVGSGPGGINSNERLGYTYNGNPNRYASNWILVRRVTLLCPPQAAELYQRNQDMSPFMQNENVDRRATRDIDSQVALQPASSSIFRSLAAQFPVVPPSFAMRLGDQGYDHPRIDSGLVDIATTSLSEIRLIVATSNKYPNQVGPNFFDPTSNQSLSTVQEQNHAGPDGVFRYFDAANPSPPDAQLLDRTQSWMDDALPAFDTGPANQQTRIHCEPAPPNLMGVSSNYNGMPQAYRRSDQMMLSSSNFLPHCTEFIVEWSFGDTDAGQPKWHGLQRSANGAQVCKPYDDNPNGPDILRVQVPLVQTNTFALHDIPTVLIHRVPFANITPEGPLSSYFGYIDPTFNPDRTGNGLLGDAQDARDGALPWQWPALIRVTLSLADPNDPSVEQSFQFVFQVPQSTP